MTPLEELQAAHKRLSALREQSDKYDPAPWFIDDHVDTARVATNGGTGDVCWNDGGGVFDGDTADLIVTLHRTIDAQLGLLWKAVEWEAVKMPRSPWWRDALDLARAINGEAS